MASHLLAVPRSGSDLAGGAGEATWTRLSQPGKVFYADPEEDRAPIPTGTA